MNKLSFSSFFKHYGPGVIMASSCVGGSHIIASVQAGAYYGWQLACLIVLVNVLKYPFFRLAFDYSSLNGQNLLYGYAQQGRLYLTLFFAFNLFATVVNIAGGTLLSAALLALMLPESWGNLNILNILIMLSFIWLLFGQQYQKLDGVSKAMMLLLTMVTVVALGVAIGQPKVMLPADWVEPNPWTLAAFPFLVALMGWMPAPMELSVSSSMWVVEKMRLHPEYRQQYRRDFHVSYGVTIVLALMFMALGAWVEFGQAVQGLSGGKFVGQFVDMYAHSMGEWLRLPIALMAFSCIYGTTIVAVDGYSRGNQQAWALLRQHHLTEQQQNHQLRLWTAGALILAWVLIQFFSGAIGKMIPFAMTASFISAPVFAWLNWRLRKQCGQQPMWFNILAWMGLLYLLICVAIYFQAA